MLTMCQQNVKHASQDVCLHIFECATKRHASASVASTHRARHIWRISITKSQTVFGFSALSDITEYRSPYRTELCSLCVTWSVLWILTITKWPACWEVHLTPWAKLTQSLCVREMVGWVGVSLSGCFVCFESGPPRGNQSISLSPGIFSLQQYTSCIHSQCWANFHLIIFIESSDIHTTNIHIKSHTHTHTHRHTLTHTQHAHTQAHTRTHTGTHMQRQTERHLRQIIPHWVKPDVKFTTVTSSAFLYSLFIQ